MFQSPDPSYVTKITYTYKQFTILDAYPNKTALKLKDKSNRAEIGIVCLALLDKETL